MRITAQRGADGHMENRMELMPGDNMVGTTNAAQTLKTLHGDNAFTLRFSRAGNGSTMIETSGVDDNGLSIKGTTDGKTGKLVATSFEATSISTKEQAKQLGLMMPKEEQKNWGRFTNAHVGRDNVAVSAAGTVRTDTNGHKVLSNVRAQHGLTVEDMNKNEFDNSALTKTGKGKTEYTDGTDYKDVFASAIAGHLRKATSKEEARIWADKIMERMRQSYNIETTDMTQFRKSLDVSVGLTTPVGGTSVKASASETTGSQSTANQVTALIAEALENGAHGAGLAKVINGEINSHKPGRPPREGEQ